MVEILGLVLRVVITVVLETLPSWDFSRHRESRKDRRENRQGHRQGHHYGYRDYLRTVPTGQTPMSRHQWKTHHNNSHTS